MSLEPGTRLGTFEIVAPLGAGGMGEVYRARDLKLGRDVAIKVVTAAETADPAARDRLVREAQTASRLNHPHVCTVFDANLADDRVYIAMELVEGETLSAIVERGSIPSDRVLRYAAQIADGLAHAHQRGIVHRDLKAANIVITPDGRAKILDFGLAKPLGDDAGRGTTVTALSGAGVITGTVAYMAPEVLRGAPADTCSDIWSLGIVVFEMLAGRRPFGGSNALELTAAIVSSPLPALPESVPRGLSSIVATLLAKLPGERYQHASEIRAALEALSWSSGAPVHAPPRSSRAQLAIVALAAVMAMAAGFAAWRQWRSPSPPASVQQLRSIAVLPLANLSGDAAQNLFADGITDALITDLARVKGLDVISRTSTMLYRNSAKRLPEIARELGVDAMVQGSVLRVGDRVRVSAQLIEAATDRHLWADEYDRDVRDVLSLQRDVARAIALEVRDTLTPQEEAGLTVDRRVDPAAHALFLRGRELVYRLDEAPIAEAIGVLEEALRIDPQFAEAWVALAAAHTERGIWGRPVSSVDTAARAREAITRALALDPLNPEAHAIVGQISMVYDWDWTAAERALRRSIELAPGSGRARSLISALFQAMRRFPEGVAEAEVFRRLDPVNAQALSSLGRVLYRSREFDRAIEAFNQSIALDPLYGPSYARLADVYMAMGRFDDAIRVLDRGQQVLGGTRRQVDGYATVYAMAGRTREARAALAELIERSKTADSTFYSIAVVQTALGDHTAAFESLDRAFAARSASLFLVNSEIKFDALRSDPRYADLMRRMKMPGY